MHPENTLHILKQRICRYFRMLDHRRLFDIPQTHLMAGAEIRLRSDGVRRSNSVCLFRIVWAIAYWVFFILACFGLSGYDDGNVFSECGRSLFTLVIIDISISFVSWVFSVCDWFNIFMRVCVECWDYWGFCESWGPFVMFTSIMFLVANVCISYFTFAEVSYLRSKSSCVDVLSDGSHSEAFSLIPVGYYYGVFFAEQAFEFCIYIVYLIRMDFETFNEEFV